MNEIFEKIPKAEDIKNNLNKETQETMEYFINKVIKTVSSMNSNSTNVYLENKEYELLNGIHGDKVRNAFSLKGWKLEQVNDQRDGKYVIISMKEKKYYSQFDR